MSSQSIVCASCNETVPYGRLSCPSCGALLASVAGAAPREVAAPSKKRAAAKPRAGAAVSTAVAEPVAAQTTDEPQWPASLPSTPAAAQTPDEPQWPVALPSTPTAAGGGSVRWAEPGPPAVLKDVADGWPPPAAAAAPAAPASTPAATPAPAAPAATAPTTGLSPSYSSAPGAYVPPLPLAEQAGPPAPARAWAGYQAADAGATAASATAESTAASLLDKERVSEFIGWLAVAGSAMGAVGFLLPWGRSVIGASGVDYVDRWGLAGPYHPLFVLAMLAILAGALVPNPIPARFRIGLAGLGFGALVVGLVWPYITGLPGTGPGALVTGLGGIVLVAAGIAALVVPAERHAVEDEAV